MAKESLQAKLAAYEEKVAEMYAKRPERPNLKHNKLYTPLDVEGFDYERDLGIPVNTPTHAVYNQQCIAVVCGRCVCMRALRQRKNRTNAIVT